MKKVVFILFALLIMNIQSSVFAETEYIPEGLMETQNKYSDLISVAIEKSEYEESQIDKEHIFIVENTSPIPMRKNSETVWIYVALPIADSSEISYAHFDEGEYVSAITDFTPFIGMEMPYGEKLKQYIDENNLSDPSEITNMWISERVHVFAYNVICDNEEYIIPYYFTEESLFNPVNEKECEIELGKAYTLDEFLTICEKESELYAEYLKEQREKENKTVITQNEDGDEVVRIGGINLEDIESDILENISVMENNSYVEINLSPDDEKFSSVHRFENGSNAKELEKFIEGLFEELSLQAGKKTDSFVGENGCDIKLRYKENGKWVWHHTYIDLSGNAVRIRTQNYDDISFELKNADAVRIYLAKASKSGFKTFDNRRYGENTADIVGNIEGLTKTDVVKFSYEMPENTENDLSEEVTSGGSVVSGILERYKENKYKSTYILTLKGNKGTVSFYVEHQASLSGDGEKLSNNIPLYFLNQNRYENEKLLSYPMKDSNSYTLKMTFVKNELSKVVFEYTDCDILEYTSLTEDTEFEEKFTEREKPSESLKKLGIMNGDPDGNMRLNDNITRAEAVALLVRVHKGLDRKVSAEFTGFSDMKGHWADKEIAYAKNAGITDGTSDSTFSPQNNITVQEFVKMLVSLLGYGQEAEAMGGYPHGYIKMGTKLGILKDISVSVSDTAVREDVASMLDYGLDIAPVHLKEVDSNDKLKTLREILEEE